MTYVIYATVRAPVPVDHPVRDSRNIWLESMDGVTVIPIASEWHAAALSLLTGVQGFGVVPVDVRTGAVPGATGSLIEDVTTPDRPTLLPFSVKTQTQAQQWAAVQALRDLTDPHSGMTRDGNFRLVCSSASGVRQLTLAYRGGLEGDDLGLTTYDRFVLDCLAPYPYAQDRESRTLEFSLGGGEPFLSASPGTDLPWGTRQLAPSTVIGEGMAVEMTSAVPVYPTISITGPVDSVLITADSGLRIDIPTGVLAGQTLVIVTDPRAKSTRLDGALAAGKIARGSLYKPFTAGANTIDVVAPGATSDTRLALTWRGGYRSLW